MTEGSENPGWPELCSSGRRSRVTDRSEYLVVAGALPVWSGLEDPLQPEPCREVGSQSNVCLKPGPRLVWLSWRDVVIADSPATGVAL